MNKYLGVQFHYGTGPSIVSWISSPPVQMALQQSRAIIHTLGYQTEDFEWQILAWTSAGNSSQRTKLRIYNYRKL